MEASGTPMVPQSMSGEESAGETGAVRSQPLGPLLSLKGGILAPSGWVAEGPEMEERYQCALTAGRARRERRRREEEGRDGKRRVEEDIMVVRYLQGNDEIDCWRRTK